jgi:hypothetical protein
MRYPTSLLSGLFAMLLMPACSPQPADIKLSDLKSVCDYTDAMASLLDQYHKLRDDRSWWQLTYSEQLRINELMGKCVDIKQARDAKYTYAEKNECESRHRVEDMYNRTGETGIPGYRIIETDIEGYEIYFSGKGDNEPSHIFLFKDGGFAKFWLEPVEFASYDRTSQEETSWTSADTKMKAEDVRRAKELVEANKRRLILIWDEYFGR